VLIILGFIRLGTSSPHLTTDVLSRFEEHKRSQLDEWLKDPQSHEQLALGQKTSRASQQITTFLNDIETKVEGDGK